MGQNMVLNPIVMTVDLAQGGQVFVVGFLGVFAGLGLLYLGLKGATAIVHQLEKSKARTGKAEGGK